MTPAGWKKWNACAIVSVSCGSERLKPKAAVTRRGIGTTLAERRHFELALDEDTNGSRIPREPIKAGVTVQGLTVTKMPLVDISIGVPINQAPAIN